MGVWETVRLKVRRIYIHRTAGWRRKKLKSQEWTIISNNCWGGFVYQSYGLPYLSPTVGCFFMAEDYLRFVSDLRKWAARPLLFLKPGQSSYAKVFETWDKFGTYPIGVLFDGNSRVEIHFLHYRTEEEAREHWETRTERICWDKILYKFNDQNLCTEEHIRRFLSLPLKNKICFSVRDYGLPGVVFVRCPGRTGEIPASREPFGASRRINVNELLNTLAAEQQDGD